MKFLKRLFMGVLIATTVLNGSMKSFAAVDDEISSITEDKESMDVFEDDLETGVSDFVIQPFAASYPQPANMRSGEWYYIKNAFSGLYLDVQGGTNANGQNVIQYPYTGGSNQKWQIVDCGNGAYRIVSGISSSKVLQLDSSSTADGTNINIYNYSGLDRQKFGISRAPTGAYAIFTAYSGYNKSVVVQNASCAWSANVFQWKYNASINDQWIFEPANKKSAMGVAYSYANADRRPDAYPDCDGIGGDCTNFLSQNLLASGIHQTDYWYIRRNNTTYHLPYNSSQLNNSWSTKALQSTGKSPWISASSFGDYWDDTVSSVVMDCSYATANPSKLYGLPYVIGDAVQVMSDYGTDNIWHSLYIVKYGKDPQTGSMTFFVSSHMDNYTEKSLLEIARKNPKDKFRFYDFT